MPIDVYDRFIVNPGWVVELQKDCWLVSATADPARTLELKNATRWPTENAASRAFRRARKLSGRAFRDVEIYFVEK